jgi:FtsP/CotA-like multicopper oxidase with cupredoxin domain
MVNTTGEFHPMHLHGHVMTVLDVDGRAPVGSPLHLDTVLLGPHETADVTFVADNPGIWMLHCHVLVHASMGMSMSINYSGVSTPFEMGSHSGNVPE